MAIIEGITVAIIFLLAILFFLSLKIVKEYERIMIFRRGRAKGFRGPGLVIIIPFFEKGIIIDTKTVNLEELERNILTLSNYYQRYN